MLPILWHSGGIAGHISRAAGPNFQTMCNAISAALPQGIVEVGSCVVTEAGQLPCDKVIHAVGPNFAGQILLLPHNITPYEFAASSLVLCHGQSCKVKVFLVCAQHDPFGFLC